MLNVWICAIRESIHVIIDDRTNDSSSQVNRDNDGVEMNVVEQPTSKSKQPQTPLDLVEIEDHPKDQILGDPLTGVKTWSQLENLMSHLCFTSKFEP